MSKLQEQSELTCRPGAIAHAFPFVRSFALNSAGQDEQKQKLTFGLQCPAGTFLNLLHVAPGQFFLCCCLFLIKEEKMNKNKPSVVKDTL